MSLLVLQEAQGLLSTGQALGHFFVYYFYVLSNIVFPNLPNQRIPPMYFLKI